MGGGGGAEMVCMDTRQKRACQKWMDFVKENVNTNDKGQKKMATGSALEVDKRKYQKNDGWTLYKVQKEMEEKNPSS